MKLMQIIRKAGFSTVSWEDTNRSLINYPYKGKNSETIRCDNGNSWIQMDISRKFSKPDTLYIEIWGNIENQQEVIDGMPVYEAFMQQVKWIKGAFPSSRILYIDAPDSGIYKKVRVRGNKHLYVKRKKRKKNKR